MFIKYKQGNNLVKNLVVAFFVANISLTLFSSQGIQAMERPPGKDEPSKPMHHRVDNESPQKVSKRSRFTELLSEQLEVDRFTKDLSKVHIAPKSNKRSQMRDDESGTETLKKTRGSSERDTFLNKLVNQEIAPRNQKAVLDFLMLPGLLNTLTQSSGVDADYILFWEPILKKQAPHCLDFLHLPPSSKSENDCPDAIKEVLEEHSSAYEKWQKLEDNKEFARRFIQTLNKIPDAKDNTLQRAITLATTWYNVHQDIAWWLLHFFGYPHEKMEKPKEQSCLPELQPETAGMVIEIIEKLQNINQWADVNFVGIYMKLVKDISVTSFQKATHFYLKQGMLDPGWRDYNTLIDYWKIIALLDKSHKPETLDRLIQEAQQKQDSYSILSFLKEESQVILPAPVD
jgi:hypothetical protein